MPGPGFQDWESKEPERPISGAPAGPTATDALYHRIVCPACNGTGEMLATHSSGDLIPVHELIHPDNGRCNQCGGHWNYKPDGKWDYVDGDHTEDCIARRIVEEQEDADFTAAMLADVQEAYRELRDAVQHYLSLQSFDPRDLVGLKTDEEIREIVADHSAELEARGADLWEMVSDEPDGDSYV